MLKNFFTSAFRSLWKNKGISVLNIAGLALGLTSFLLVTLYVIDEIRYDRYNTHHDRIFRMNTELKYNDAITSYAVAAPPLGEALVNNFPEVEKSARLMPLRNVRFKKAGEILREDRVFYADPELFNIFTLPAVHGDPSSALTAPHGIIITESVAKRYFNSTDAIGKTIAQVDDTTLLVVGAVIKDMPSQSHFHADFFLSLASNASARNTNFNQFTFHTYVLLKPGTNESELEAKFPPFLRKHLSNNLDMDKFEKGGNFIQIGLTALNDIHLHSNKQRELEGNGDIQYVYIFSAVAILILFLACVNFMNLSTARSANRAREVGVRKVLGSLRQTLIAQFLAESILLTLISIAAACIFAWLLLPVFNQIAGKNIMITMEDLHWMVPVLAGLTLAVGILAGFYPAFFLSRFQPIHVLKGKLSTGFKGSRLRGILVVFQFSTSTFLIIGAFVIYHQLSYILNKDVGFDREQVLIIKYVSVLEDPGTLKEQVKALSGVKSASLSGYLPTGGSRGSNGISVPGKEGLLSEFWLVDSDYVPTMGMTLQAGRNFSEQLATDSSAIIINETAAKMLGFSNAPLNQVIHAGPVRGFKDYNVIGIVKDFNFNSLRENITPLVMIMGYDWSASLNVRVEGSELTSVLGQIKDRWKELMPDQEFDYSFMDEDFEAIYKTEIRIENLFMVFAFMAIVIACLGLFGLSAYTTEQRNKEMSIRKILGATTANLMTALSLDFIKPVLIAILITIPLAWLAMEEWLQTFAYRESIPAWTFIMAGLSMIVIAMATISFQCAKAALANPADNLRSE
jgi:putative ABC transport system permease protein